MKKFLKAALVSALALVSFVGFSATNVKAESYLHTLKPTSLYSKGDYVRNDSDGKPIFNFEPITNTGLLAYTDWKYDEFRSDPYQPFSRVATNEWVAVDDVAFVETYNPEDAPTATFDKPIKAYSLDPKTYKLTYVRTLPAGSWKDGGYIKFPHNNGTYIYHKVATNEWIAWN